MHTLTKWTPQYPNRVMEIIDDLVVEKRERRDFVLEE